jgi:nucleoside-diphosphate-sugar epimerase
MDHMDRSITQPIHALVTGGGGFLGGAVVRMLVERGDRVRSFSRGRYPGLDALGVEQRQGDLAEPEPVAAACEGVEVVFHVAARAGVWGNEEDYRRTNLVGTRNVIEACRRHGVDRLVYTSSPSVVFGGVDMAGVDESVPYPRQWATAYQRSKAAAERAVRSAADERLRTVCLRPHLIWGPKDNHLVPRIIARAGSLRIIGDGTNRVDTVYVDNAARAHLQAADRLAESPELSGRCYFVSQGDPVPLWDMVNAILHAAGLPPVERKVPLWAARSVGAVLEAVYKVFGLPGEPKMTRFLAEELATEHWFDIGAARRDLGYEPEVSMEEGLRRLADWLRESASANR